MSKTNTIPAVPPPNQYVRKGFGLKAEVQETLSADYSGHLVDLLRENDYTLVVGDVTVRLAREFGFCYGVERAVDYAYQTRRKFPEKRIFLAGEIIHNPHVNAKLKAMDIVFLGQKGTGFDYAPVRPADVVLLPAFGVTIHDFEMLRELGCVVVDTTCGSVLNVWKRVESYARDAFTALIHGKYYHEETRATASQVEKYDGGTYIIVRDMDEARIVMDYIEFSQGVHIDRPVLSRDEFMQRFSKQIPSHFDPDIHLSRIGVANQTTMLARESLAIAHAVGEAMERAYGADHRAEHFRSFDTICSATQDRQDAVAELMRDEIDMMVVVGGYNSSNTISLAALCAEKVDTVHISDPDDIDVVNNSTKYRTIGPNGEVTIRESWIPSSSPFKLGITAGASTPNNKIGETISRILSLRGIEASNLL